MKPGKNIFISLFLFLLISINISAQTDSVSSKKLRGIFNTDKWAIQFEETKYPDFTGTRDLSVIGRRYLTNNSLMRGGISFIGFLVDINNSGSYTNPYVNASGSNPSYRSNGIQVFMQYLYYPIESKSVNFFFGGGPAFISFNRTAYQNILYYSQGNSPGSIIYSLYAKTIQKTWGDGLLFSTGIEWMATNILGISAEYDILYVDSHTSAATYNMSNFLNLAVISSSPSRNALDIEISEIKFGLLVYL